MTRPTRQTPSGRAYLDLQNQARQQRRPTQELLILYALERWLARLQTSAYSANFVLKGGMLLAALDARRTTVDADLMGRGVTNNGANIARIVAEIAAIETTPDDGVNFDAGTIETQVIRESDHYSGVRVSMMAHLGSARLRVLLDVNFGDPVVPEPRPINMPPLRPSLEAVSVLGYPIEVVLAEKLCTAIALAAANTRIRDYADVYTSSLGIYFSSIRSNVHSLRPPGTVVSSPSLFKRPSVGSLMCAAGRIRFTEQASLTRANICRHNSGSWSTSSLASSRRWWNRTHPRQSNGIQSRNNGCSPALEPLTLA